MGLRKDVTGLSGAGLDALRRAMAAIMALPDERGYQFFSGLHGLPVPTYCQHGTLLFLPWHRAYLYFFELALQDQVPGVTVPWWDWTSSRAHDEGLPSSHVDAASADGSPNPLLGAEVWLPDDQLALVRQLLPGALTDDDPPRTVRDPDLPDELPRAGTIADILDAPTFEDFSLRLENVHGDVHVWVGGSMSEVPVAAFDPVFWSHHAMIDRLWYLWQMRHPGLGPAPRLLGLVLPPFPMTVADTLDVSALGYDYASQVLV